MKRIRFSKKTWYYVYSATFHDELQRSHIRKFCSSRHVLAVWLSKNAYFFHIKGRIYTQYGLHLQLISWSYRILRYYKLKIWAFSSFHSQEDMIRTELVQRLAVVLFCMRSTYILCGKCESNNCLSVRVSIRSTAHCVFINRRAELAL